MELNKLLDNVSHYKKANFNPDITTIACNTKNIKNNTLFACLKGVNFDGHCFAKKAIELGASCVLVEKDLNIKNQIVVKNTHIAYGKICANFFGNPAKKLKFIGVTGTNGKTTVSTIIKNILSFENKKSGLIGTIQNKINDETFKTEQTTPNHFEFQKLIKKMLDNGCEYVVMEVSSHALSQHRIADTKFELAVFTNLSQDHLDYHKTMKNYFETKKMLFKKAKQSLICIDDEYGLEIFKEFENENMYTFAIKKSNSRLYSKRYKANI